MLERSIGQQRTVTVMQSLVPLAAGFGSIMFVFLTNLVNLCDGVNQDPTSIKIADSDVHPTMGFEDPLDHVPI